MQEAPSVSAIHLHTIKTISGAVKLFENAFRTFMEFPSGENYKDMEEKREQMFLTSDICLQTSFPETDNIDIKDAIRVSKEIKKLKAHPSDATAL